MKLIINNDRIIATATNDYIGPDNFILVPDNFDINRIEEYRVIDGAVVLPQLPPPDPKTTAFTALGREYDTRVQALAAGYSQYERESWPVQTAEATAYTADPQAATPWLDAASAARGIDKAELAARVIAMDAAYRQIHGALTGHRQKLWDQINAAQTTDEIAAIDVTAGWPA